MGPDRRFGSFGLCFGPNGRFSTHFGPYLMFLDLTELWPMWPICPDGTRRALTDDSMDPYRCTTHVRTPMGPHDIPMGPQGPCWDPSNFNPLPGPTACDTETLEPDQPPSGSRP